MKATSLTKPQARIAFLLMEIPGAEAKETIDLEGSVSLLLYDLLMQMGMSQEHVASVMARLREDVKAFCQNPEGPPPVFALLDNRYLVVNNQPPILDVETEESLDGLQAAPVISMAVSLSGVYQRILKPLVLV